MAPTPLQGRLGHAGGGGGTEYWEGTEVATLDEQGRGILRWKENKVMDTDLELRREPQLWRSGWKTGTREPQTTEGGERGQGRGGEPTVLGGGSQATGPLQSLPDLLCSYDASVVLQTSSGDTITCFTQTEVGRAEIWASEFQTCHRPKPGF